MVLVLVTWRLPAVTAVTIEEWSPAACPEGGGGLAHPPACEQCTTMRRTQGRDNDGPTHKGKPIAEASNHQGTHNGFHGVLRGPLSNIAYGLIARVHQVCFRVALVGTNDRCVGLALVNETRAWGGREGVRSEPASHPVGTAVDGHRGFESLVCKSHLSPTICGHIPHPQASPYTGSSVLLSLNVESWTLV